jgi:hypothetical protein
MIYALLLVVASSIAMNLMFRVRPREIDSSGAPAVRYLAAPYIAAVFALCMLLFGVYQWLDRASLVNPGDLVLLSFMPLIGSAVLCYTAIYFFTYRLVLRTNTLDVTHWPFGSRELKLNQLLSVEQKRHKTILMFAGGQKLVIYEGISGTEYFVERVKALLPAAT